MTNDEINRYIHTKIMGNDVGYLYCANCGGRNISDGQCNERSCQGSRHVMRHGKLLADYCSDKSPRSLLNEVIAKFESSGNARWLADTLDNISDKGITVIWWPSAETFARACVEAWKAK